MLNLPPFKFRASSLGLIMADAQSIDPALLDDETAAIARKTKKTDADKAILEPLKLASLSAGAKSYCEQVAGEYVYGYENIVTGKYMEKGLAVEDQSIELYNSVFFTNHKKNTERRTNDWITGECDIFDGRTVKDIKSAWSLATFPKTPASAHDPIYEWQGRAYMWLWGAEEFELAFCLVNTPDELIGYEREELHYVDHIDPQLRVTRLKYQRDRSLEDRMRVKADAANKYINKMIQEIIASHQG